MAEFVLRNTKIFLNGYDISGVSNNLTATLNIESLDKTVFGSSARKFKAGLITNEISVDGFFTAGDSSASANFSDNAWNNALASTASVMSIVPSGSSLGTTQANRAYLTKGLSGSYSPTGTVGDLFSISGGFMGIGHLLRGQLMTFSSAQSTATSLVIKKLGTRSSTQKVYAAVHVMNISTSGARLKLHVEQDNSTTFAGTPSTAMTQSLSSSDVGTAIWLDAGSTAGSSDDHSWRVKFSTTAALNTPDMKLAVTMAIK